MKIQQKIENAKSKIKFAKLILVDCAIIGFVMMLLSGGIPATNHVLFFKFLVLGLFILISVLGTIIIICYDLLEKYRQDLKNKLNSEFKKVKIDTDYNPKRLAEIFKDSYYLQTYAKVGDYPYSNCNIILKVVFEGKDGICAEREFTLDRNSIQFLHVED